MKKLFIALCALPLIAIANNVDTITYDNGDVYTVADDENVFVSKSDNLWLQQVYPKTTQFKKQWPTTKVDQPEPTPNPNPIGTKDWCEAHDLHANGYTFDDQIWYRDCDTNNDGQYNQCDWYEPTGESTFEEAAWQDLCNDGNPYDPDA